MLSFQNLGVPAGALACPLPRCPCAQRGPSLVQAWALVEELRLSFGETDYLPIYSASLWGLESSDQKFTVPVRVQTDLQHAE